MIWYWFATRAGTRCGWRPVLLKILRYWDLAWDIDIENLNLRYWYRESHFEICVYICTRCGWRPVLPEFNVTGILFAVGQITWGGGQVWRKVTNLLFLKIEILDLDMGRSDGCDGRCPPMASVTKPVEKYQSGLKISYFNPESVKNDIKNRVLGRGWNDNGIWHFGLCWSLLCQLKWEEL